MHSLAEIEAQMHLRQQQQHQHQPQTIGPRLTPQLREASPGLYDSPARLLQQRSPQVTQQQLQQLQRATPPPRMHPHAQSPRFHQLQQEILIQQQQHQLEEQRHLHALHERLQLEEFERRQGRGEAEAEALRRMQRIRLEEQQLAVLAEERAYLGGGDAQAMQQQIQRQQRLLSEAAQADFLRSQGIDSAAQEELRQDVLRRIIQAEQLEKRRSRKLAKIAHMVCFHGLSVYFVYDDSRPATTIS